MLCKIYDLTAELERRRELLDMYRKAQTAHDAWYPVYLASGNTAAHERVQHHANTMWCVGQMIKERGMSVPV